MKTTGSLVGLRGSSLSALAALGAAISLAPECAAQTVRWINPAGGLFATGTNWDAGHPPATTDTAAFGPNIAYTVTMGASATVANAVIDQGAVTLNGPGSLNVGPPLLTGDLTVAGPMGAPASLRIASGAVRGAMAGNIYIGTAEGTAGSVTVEQGATLQVGTCMIGPHGSMIVRGSLTQSPYGNGFVRAQPGASLRMEGATVAVQSLSSDHAPLDIVGGSVVVDVAFGGSAAPISISAGASVHGSTIDLGGSVRVVEHSNVSGTFIGFGGSVVVQDAGTICHASGLNGDSFNLEVLDGAAVTWGPYAASLTGSPRILVASGCSFGGGQGDFWMTDGGTLHIDQGAGVSFYDLRIGPGSAIEVTVDGASLPSTPMITCPSPMALQSTLAGQLRIDLAHPNNLRVGDQFEVLRCGRAYSGAFAGLSAPVIGGGRQLQLFLTPTSVFVQVVAGGQACWTTDFDGDGDVGTDADIEAFFACLAGNCCATCGSADFNNDGEIVDNDIEAFFRVLAGGPC